MKIDMKSSVYMNEKMPVLDETNEDNSTHLRLLEASDIARDDSDVNSNYYKGDVDNTPIDSTNDTTCSYQNQDVNINRNFNAPSLSSANRKYVFPKIERVRCHKISIFD